MPFLGLIYASVFVVFANVATVYWTNPTPAPIAVQWRAQREGSPDTLCLPRYFGRQDAPMEKPALKGGRLDSLYITVPPADKDSVRWSFWYYTFDSTWGRSFKSPVTKWTQRRGQ